MPGLRGVSGGHEVDRTRWTKDGSSTLKGVVDGGASGRRRRGGVVRTYPSTHGLPSPSGVVL